MATKKTTDWALPPSPDRVRSTDHVRIDLQTRKQYELFINGKWQKPKSGKYFDTINPANEQKLARIAEANEADVDAAVKAARKAYDSVVQDARRANARQVISTASRACCRRRPASSPSSKAWTAARPSAKAATTCPSPPRTSSTTPVGPTSSHYAFPGKQTSPLGVAGQVIPGTSCCSWPRGSSPSRSPAATPWC